jgi:uncharacterized DUF497 family protein
MEIEFDPAKDAINQAKHGVSLDLALVILARVVGEAGDTRFDYGEVRVNAFGLVAGRLFVCTYTMRGPVFRIISVRKAHRKEQAQWLG